MKRTIRIIGMVVIVLIAMTTVVNGGQHRVICDVEVVGDHVGKVSLKWSDDHSSTGIMIAGLRFSDDGLTVTYRTDEKVTAGFDSSTVKSNKHTFPMKVFLEDYNARQRNQSEESDSKIYEFTDLRPTNAGYDSIMNLYYRGIINGYPEGNFLPNKGVTRAEFSKMLLMTAEYAVDNDATSIFEDVPDDFWGRKYIMTLAGKEILKGKGEGQFDPNGSITIGEVLTVINRTFFLYESGSDYPHSLEKHWSNEYFEEVVKQGLVTSVDHYYKPYTPDAKATREDCSVLLSRVLEGFHDVTE